MLDAPDAEPVAVPDLEAPALPVALALAPLLVPLAPAEPVMVAEAAAVPAEREAKSSALEKVVQLEEGGTLGW